jgi:hypothetical protein
VAVLCCVTAGAEPINWDRAEGGVSVVQGTAYSGCAVAGSIADVRARKVAILRAQANIVRSRHLLVSGVEHAKVNNQETGSSYSLKVVEESSDFLRQVVVVDEELAMISNVRNLCVLVVEQEH